LTASGYFQSRMTRIRRDLRRERLGRLMATSPWLFRGPWVGRILGPSADILGYPTVQDSRGRHDFFTNLGNLLREEARPNAWRNQHGTTENEAAVMVAIGKEAVPRRYLRANGNGRFRNVVRGPESGSGFRGELSAISTTSRADMDRTRKNPPTGQDRMASRILLTSRSYNLFDAETP
jgi:hypothetical protein